MGKAPSFAVDIMLGKLAKWLRLMGFDTFYSNSAQDDFLMELTLRERRILLTRDRPLVERLGNAAYFVQNIFLPEQLREVTAEFLLHRFHLSRRCSVCNGAVALISKTKVESQVPLYIFQTQEKFFQCENCGRLYWEGTHVRHIKEIISGAFQAAGDKNSTLLEKADEQQEGR